MYIFRADGNSKIGAGHIMRCLSIASSATDMGETCKFILASEDFKDVVISNGHQVEILHSDYSVLNPEEITDRLNFDTPSVVIVDSYFVTEEYMEALHISCKKANCKLVYIDDRCSSAYSCDILVNYNISADVDDYKKLYDGKNEPMFLVGTIYAPLRKEFQNQEERTILSDARNILVSTGGADPEHLTCDLVDEAKNYRDYCFHFILGMMNPDKERIRESAFGYSNIIFHENVTEMCRLMRVCDVAISASGSTLYELCATQTPTISYVIADNQIPIANSFNELGIIRNVGDIRILGNGNLSEELIRTVVDLIGNYDLRVKLSNKMIKIVDGNGARRLAEMIF